MSARDLRANRDTAPEARALGLHLGDPAVEDRLFHLELRDAVPQQPTGPIGTFENRHCVASARQLLGRGQTRRPRADHSNGLAREPLWWLWHDRTRLKGPVDRRDLDLLDGDRWLVDAEHACGLTGRRAQPSGELGEVVRGVQPLDRLAPLPLPGQVVPLRDQVAEWTSAVAERNSAVHAPAGLPTQLVDILSFIDLTPVLQAHRHRPTGRQLALTGGEKALGVSHETPP